MELWHPIVNKVNAVGCHPRTRNDIRKRWNDLRGKVRSMASRHHIAVQKTGGGPPPTPPDYSDWEEKVSAHQKRGLWHAIAKEVRTLGVYNRQEQPLQEEVGGPAALGEEDL
ncbi:hypothetical protein NDU88_002637 [Pleurodeles waltl]|uniref:Myb/SANT-like DNA-binding domain-containing protein n=1 Tax=Pleurodeles waltl TaxID=8319 RepID=A0AAV7VZX5_PLEWA|nr:hypothetical protein NDU88_002637 [Pleurodeles waltl]